MAPHKCDVCGGPYPSFHICNPNPDREIRISSRKDQRSDAHRQRMSESLTLRWQIYREENQARDERIVERYNEGGVGQVALADMFGVSKSTIQKILKEASARGLVKVRPPGTTLAKGAE